MTESSTMKLLLTILTLLILQPIHAREFRDLTNSEGNKIKAELLDLRDQKLKIRFKGRVFELPMDKLSQEDQIFVAKWQANRNEGKSETENPSDMETIFEDDFSGESFDEQWHHNDASMMKEGVLYVTKEPDSSHPGGSSVRFEGRKDMHINVKFKFSGPEAKGFMVKFGDKQYKGSHAGHICRVGVNLKNIVLLDSKTGGFKNEIFKMKQSGNGLDEATKKLLKEKEFRQSITLEKEKWYQLALQTKEDVMTLFIDGEKIAELKSAGIAHENKTLAGIVASNTGVAFDDFTLKATPIKISVTKNTAIK